VIDQNLSMGMGGVLHGELLAALYGQSDAPPVVASFVGGLGGRDIGAEEFYEMAQTLKRAADEGRTPPARLLYTQGEMLEINKLRAIAHVEREELNRGS
jgi:pyruvate ferredoxin oxidoreductase alpha subunit